MKNIILFIAVLFLTACNNANGDGEVNTDVITNSASATGDTGIDLPEIEFEEEVYDFGRITQGEKVNHVFKFKNVGDGYLIISGASGSCGCTVPKWPEEPIRPGGMGEIDVVFSSEGKSGLQEKTVTVVTNCEPATKVIRIKTEIIVAETAR
jgi:hypothetical protein